MTYDIKETDLQDKRDLKSVLGREAVAVLPMRPGGRTANDLEDRKRFAITLMQRAANVVHGVQAVRVC